MIAFFVETINLFMFYEMKQNTKHEQNLLLHSENNTKKQRNFLWRFFVFRRETLKKIARLH